MKKILSLAADTLVVAMGIILFLVACSGMICTFWKLVVWGIIAFCYFGLLDRLYNITKENNVPPML